MKEEKKAAAPHSCTVVRTTPGTQRELLSLDPQRALKLLVSKSKRNFEVTPKTLHADLRSHDLKDLKKKTNDKASSLFIFGTLISSRTLWNRLHVMTGLMGHEMGVNSRQCTGKCERESGLTPDEGIVGC